MKRLFFLIGFLAFFGSAQAQLTWQRAITIDSLSNVWIGSVSCAGCWTHGHHSALEDSVAVALDALHSTISGALGLNSTLTAGNIDTNQHILGKNGSFVQTIDIDPSVGNITTGQSSGNHGTASPTGYNLMSGFTTLGGIQNTSTTAVLVMKDPGSANSVILAPSSYTAARVDYLTDEPLATTTFQRGVVLHKTQDSITVTDGTGILSLSKNGYIYKDGTGNILWNNLDNAGEPAYFTKDAAGNSSQVSATLIMAGSGAGPHECVMDNADAVVGLQATGLHHNIASLQDYTLTPGYDTLGIVALRNGYNYDDIIWPAPGMTADINDTFENESGYVAMLTDTIGGRGLGRLATNTTLHDTASALRTTFASPFVAKGNLVAQTSVGNICTFTVGGSNAAFRIGGYVNVTAISTDIIQFQVSYTDENSNSVTYTFGATNASSAVPATNIGATGDWTLGDQRFRCKASSTITVKTILGTGGGSFTADMGATIEQLPN